MLFVVIPCHSLRYSKCSVDISSSHICEAEAEVGGSDRQTPVAPTKVKRGESVLPSDAKGGTEEIFCLSAKKQWF